MRVLLVNRFFFPDHSATSQLLSDFAHDLAQQGVSIAVITSRQRYDNPGASLLKRDRAFGVDILRVWSTSFGRSNLLGRALDYLSFYLSSFAALLRHGRVGDIAIIKTDPPLLAVFAMVACHIKGVKMVNWLQDLFPEVAIALKVPLVSGMFAQPLLTLRDYCLRNADVNVAIGSLMADHISHRLPGVPLAVIPNWADGSAIKPLSSDENVLRQQWDVQGKFVVGYSGNMGRAHDLQVLLDAAEALTKETNIVFVLIGDGGLKPALERHARERGLQNVTFKPYQERALLGQSLTAVDAHVVSLKSCLEGYIVPSKLYGCMAAGRPIIFIGSPSGEVATLMRDFGSFGYCVPADEPLALASAIRRLAADSDEAQALGKRSRFIFEQHFTKAVAMERWMRTLLPLGLEVTTPSSTDVSEVTPSAKH